MIKNEYIKIKNGKKEYVRKNKILDAYLKKIVDRQTGTLDIENSGIYQTDNQFSLNHILFKLDTPIEGINDIGKNELQLLSENENVDGLNITNNGDNSISIEGTAESKEGTTVENTSFTLTDADSTKQASILELKGQTTQSGTPTPSSPVEVETVSGDNNIVVSNKNLFNYQYSQLRNINRVTITEETNGFKLTSTGVAGYGFASLPIDNSLLGKTVTISCNSTGNKTPSARLFYHNASGTLVTNIGAFWTTNTAHTVTLPSTLPSNANGIDIVFYISQSNNASGDNAIFTDIQIEKGNQETTYTEHQGNSYRVDLGGKNLLNNTLTSGTNNGITYTVNEDKSVTMNGTATATTWLILNSSISLKAGTYTMSQGNTTNTVRVYCSALSGYCSNGVRKQTITETKTSDIAINIPNGTTISNLTLYPMVEERKHSNSIQSIYCNSYRTM